MRVLPICVCIPVLNEERNLPECLASLGQAFSEVVVVDSGSKDQTCFIAKEAGARVIQFQWDGHFPKKRNWALQNGDFQSPWVLFLDADERLTSEFIEELQKTIPGTKHSGFWLSYRNWFMGRPLKHGDIMRKLALFRIDAGRYEQFPESWWSHLDMEVHEHPVLDGTTGAIHAALEHHDYRGLHQYIARHNEYSTWEANRYQWLRQSGAEAWKALNSRQRFKYRYLESWWLSWFYFAVAYIGKRGFLDGRAGWHFTCMKKRYLQDIRLKISERKAAGGSG